MDLKCSEGIDEDRQTKCSNSLYLRILLVYRKFMILIEKECDDLSKFLEEARLLEFFKWVSSSG